MAASSSPLRREFLKGLLVALPLAVAQSLVLGWVGSFSDNPWRVVALLLPLAAAAWILGRPLYRERRLVLGGGSLAFFFAYCLLFSLAAGSELANGRRLPLSGFEREVPTNFLGLGRLGDWRYLVAPQADAARDLVVVTFPSYGGEKAWKARRTHADLVALATRMGAKGVAFDFYFPLGSGDDPLTPVMNQALCGAMAAAAEAGIPVFLGIEVDVTAGQLVPQPLPRELEACVPADRRGSLFGYRESDGRVRMVPLYLAGDEERPSISYLAAGRLGRGEVEAPASGLLQFLRPREGPLVLAAEMSPEAGGVAALTPPGEPGMDLESAARLLTGRFVFVGSRREEDRVATPYGEQVGVLVHAWAAHGLHTGQYIERLARGWTFPMIFVLCYFLTGAQAGGGGRRALLRGAAWLSVAVIATAVAAIYFGRLWVDVSYPLVAIWLLCGVLMGGAAWQAARSRARPAARSGAAAEVAVAAGVPFDVFLSHNSREKPLVAELGRALQSRGLRVWLDAWELVPGRPWQEALEEVIETVRTAAVVVGGEGLGPWEVPEMRACLDQLVQRRMPVIPVLLPGAGESPELPLFLRGLTWVDLRSGLTDDNLDRLVWGITGVKPARRLRSSAGDSG